MIFALKILAISILGGFGALIGAFTAYALLKRCAAAGWVYLPWGRRDINISNVFIVSERTPEGVERVKREVVSKLKDVLLND